MSKHDRNQIILFFLFGVTLGGGIEFIWLNSDSIESFLNSIESFTLATVATFTALWTYRTFGRNELREEVKEFIEALTEYERAIADEIHQLPLYESLSQHVQDDSYWTDQVEMIKIRKSVAAKKLKKLFDISTHIPQKIRINLFMYGGFFLDNVNKDNHKEFREQMFSLKENLRRSVSKIF